MCTVHAVEPELLVQNTEQGYESPYLRNRAKKRSNFSVIQRRKFSSSIIIHQRHATYTESYHQNNIAARTFVYAMGECCEEHIIPAFLLQSRSIWIKRVTIVAPPINIFNNNQQSIALLPLGIIMRNNMRHTNITAIRKGILCVAFAFISIIIWHRYCPAVTCHDFAHSAN